MGNMMSYEYITYSIEDSFFLGDLIKLSSTKEVKFYVPLQTTKVNRRTFDGFYTFIIEIEGQSVGIIFNDFRSFGSSFGVENSHRVGSFIDELGSLDYPLIYIANSIGVRVQDGREVFRNTFSLIEKLNRFVEKNLLLTISFGHTLGLSAILYSIGDYRLALDRSVFNLTGPEVFKMFFGSKVDFNESCNSARMLATNDLVHESFKEKEDIYKVVKAIFSTRGPKNEVKPSFESLEKLYEFFDHTGVNLFNKMGSSLISSIVKTSEGRMGLLRNPLKNGNLMAIKDIQKYSASLNLFKKLSLPFFSIVDCPGGDPRLENNDQNISRCIYDLAVNIINYPFYKRGIVIGRCFGGSSILSIPPFYGGDKTLALKDAYIGIMGNKIIEKLLTSSPVLLKTWEENKKNEKEDYSDFIEAGIVEKVIEVNEIYPEILKSLKK